MNQENGKATFLALSPSDVDVQDPNKRSKFSYIRDFLLSLHKSNSTVKLSMEAQLSISCVVDDTSGFLSPPKCVQILNVKKGEPEKFLLKVLDGVNQLLQRSNEPYRPPPS
ncbi:hypothetical protein VNO77_07128 [Canavalia gladiata]|uniref:Uncharacterized protein n=1 Tax=Canavalia gladiata TaxID=3824 RepID=A0AAN9R0F2_CANGL